MTNRILDSTEWYKHKVVDNYSALLYVAGVLMGIGCYILRFVYLPIPISIGEWIITLVVVYLFGYITEMFFYRAGKNNEERSLPHKNLNAFFQGVFTGVMCCFVVWIIFILSTRLFK